MYSFRSFLSSALFLRLAVGDFGLEEGLDLHSFVTRPDLKPPKYNVTYYDRSKVAPGYWFVSPYSFSNNVEPDVKWHACEIGPAIYDSEGELIWSGACQFGNQNFQDFRISPYPNDEGQALTGVADHSPITGGLAGIFLGSDYEVQRYMLVEEFHEFEILNGGKTLITNIGGSVNYPAEQGPDGHPFATVVEQTGFRELKTDTGDKLFEWKTLEHLDLDESIFPRPGGSDSWWEAFHLNSVDKTKDGHYLVSLRHADVILLIDGNDGHIIWRAGGKKNDFELLDDLHWARQHDARVVSRDEQKTVISFFDNGAHVKKDDDPDPPISRGFVIELNHPAEGKWTAKILRQYDRPDGGLSPKCGNLQQLPNDNVFICWTEGGYLSEHTEDGELLMEAKWLFRDRFGSYRGFKFDNWVGKPKEKPAAKAVVTGGNGVVVTMMYVSWNGATEVKSWDFYSGSAKIGSVERTGFETSLVALGPYNTIHVKALDSRGKVIGESDEVMAEMPHVENGIASDEINQTKERPAAQTHSVVPRFPLLAWANIVVLSAAGVFFAIRISRRCFGMIFTRYHRGSSGEGDFKMV